MIASKHLNVDNHLNNNPSSCPENRDGKQKRLINIAKVPSLKDILCVRIIEDLWKHPLVFHFISDIHKTSPHFINVNKGFETIVRIICTHVWCDGRLPRTVRAYMLNFIRPMGWSLFQWLHYLSYFKFTIKELTQAFSWKDNGLPDKSKSTEALIRDRKTQQYIYEIACYHCISSLVPKIWQELPASSQNYYANFASLSAYNGLNLIAYWTTFAIESEIEEQKKSTFQECHRIGNICDLPEKNVSMLLEQSPVFMEYYCRSPEFNKKNSIIDLVELAFLFREKDDYHLLQFPLNVSFSFRRRKKAWDIFDNASLICNLFSMLNYDQQIHILKKHGLFMLEMLSVDWPWRKYFFPLIEVMWDFLDENIYIKLIFTIQMHIQTGLCPEKDLLEDLWVVTPPRFKASFIDYVSDNKFIRGLLLNSTVPFFEMLLQSTDASKKQEWYEFVSTERDEYFSFLKECKLDCFDALIKSIATNDDYLDEVKTEVVQMFGRNLCFQFITDCALGKLDTFLKWCYPNDEEIRTFRLYTSENQEVLGEMSIAA